MQALDRLGKAVAHTLERHAAFCLLIFSYLFLLTTSFVAMHRALWYDELLTFHMSHLPSFGKIWEALREGADLNPPLLYIATRASQSAFGDGGIATRLPAMLGFLTMCLCIYRFVARRCPKPYAFAAMLFPLLTSGYWYAQEARSYGLELGFLGIALLAWQSSTSPNRPAWMVLVFTLALAGALLVHCYAVIAVVPFLVAESFRTYRNRRVDWAIVLSFCLLSPIIFVYLPLFSALKPFIVANSVFGPTLLSVPTFYGTLLQKGIWPIMACTLWVNARFGPDQQYSFEIPVHELVCAVSFALIPMLSFLLAVSITGIFLDRYGLASLLGLSIVAGWYFCHAGRGKTVQGGMVVALMVTWIVLFVASYFFTQTSAPSSSKSPDLSAIHSELPIVISNGLMFLEMDHYAQPNVAARLRFLTDEDAGLRYTGTNVFDRGYPLLRKWFPIRGKIEPYKSFIQAQRSFLVYGTYTHPMEWLLRRLKEEDAHVISLAAAPGPYGDMVLQVVSK
jgi:hypothetical protein